MNESERIGDQLRRTFQGEAWHGPAVQELLANVSAEKAAARPLPQLHTIWEIVAHLTAWKRTVGRRLAGEVLREPPEGDWPTTEDTSAAAWTQAREELTRASEELQQAALRVKADQLDHPRPGQNHTAYVELLGMTQHDAYHAGQIALLKKL